MICAAVYPALSRSSYLDVGKVTLDTKYGTHAALLATFKNRLCSFCLKLDQMRGFGATPPPEWSPNLILDANMGVNGLLSIRRGGISVFNESAFVWLYPLGVLRKMRWMRYATTVLFILLAVTTTLQGSAEWELCTKSGEGRVCFPIISV